MLIAPVVVSRLIPAGQLPEVAIVPLPVAPSIAGAPLTLSLAVTLAIGVEAVPATPLPVSGLAKTPTMLTCALRLSPAVEAACRVPAAAVVMLVNVWPSWPGSTVPDSVRVAVLVGSSAPICQMPDDAV